MPILTLFPIFGTVFCLFPIFSDRAPKNVSLLPGQPVDLDPAVAHCVLLAARRDHPADVARRTPARKVRALHYDSRHIQVRRTPIRIQNISTEGHAVMYERGS